MRAPFPFRRPPTALEQLLGKRRARMLRRRLGLLSIGFGCSLLKPRRTSTGLLMVVTAAALTAIAALAIA